MASIAEVEKLMRKVVRDELRTILKIDSLRKKGETHGAGYYLAHSDRNAFDAKALAEDNFPRLVDALQTLFAKTDGLTRKVDDLNGDHAEIHNKLNGLDTRLTALSKTRQTGE